MANRQASPLLMYVLVALACMLLVACAGSPNWRSDPHQAAEAARTAVKMIGTPYRFGGHTPRGFDCSGLVYYSYQQVGVSVPRTSQDQRSASKPVVSNPKKGDLVFFNLDGRHASHVGIYIGDDLFVHAPSSGKHVRTDSLSDSYWKKHFAEVRRFEAAVVALQEEQTSWQGKRTLMPLPG